MAIANLFHSQPLFEATGFVSESPQVRSGYFFLNVWCRRNYLAVLGVSSTVELQWEWSLNGNLQLDAKL